MRNRADLSRLLRRASATLAFGVVTGCAAIRPPVEPAPEPVVLAPPEPAVIAPPAVEPAPPPAQPAPPRDPPRADVVVLVDASATTHAEVADAIVGALPPRRFRVTRAASTDDLTSLEAAPTATVVAVGAAAVSVAQQALPGRPLVFCQVLAADELADRTKAVWGVQALPPLALQLKSWTAIDPSLRTVALIVGDADTPLASEARAAAETMAVDLRVETSSSDRETLYLFRRLAADVDGLWLLPDSSALSPTALRELLSYAAARGVGVLTFSDALLPRGALLSATSVPDDVARTVQGLVERVVAGRAGNLPALTPLSAAQLEVNPTIVTALGLPAVTETRWVSREPD